MTPLRGHARTFAQLCAQLPPVALITGPASVGKWTMVQHLAEHHRVAIVDRSIHPDGLVADAARAIIGFVARVPMGTVKLVAVRLDGSSPAALNALLKTLEEPPGPARFLLTASGPVLPTITSRAVHHQVGLLTDAEVAQVLVDHGMPEAAARAAAAHGRGRVAPARHAARVHDGARTAVLVIFRALATGDREMFDRVFRSFDDTTWDLLHTLLAEAITGQWSLFAPADACGLDGDQPRLRSMLFALSRLSGARRRLAVRVALEPFLTAA